MILNRQMNNIDASFSKAAAGGRKGRSTLDHLFVWQAIVDYYKHIKCDINLVFLDLEKAFDKLCLKSCLIDLYKSGVNGRCLNSIYELNKEGHVQINTPCGTTQDIKIQENLKQGTVLAAPICANHIDKGMQSIIKRKLGIRLGKVIIPPLLYQDDIMFASISIEKMQEMLNIPERFQKQNLLNFNLDKSETMKMTFGNKKRSRTDKLKLNGETLNEVMKYKYLGDLKIIREHWKMASIPGKIRQKES